MSDVLIESNGVLMKDVHGSCLYARAEVVWVVHRMLMEEKLVKRELFIQATVNGHV